MFLYLCKKNTTVQLVTVGHYCAVYVQMLTHSKFYFLVFSPLLPSSYILYLWSLLCILYIQFLLTWPYTYFNSYSIRPKYIYGAVYSPFNLDNNWMAAVFSLSRHVLAEHCSEIEGGGSRVVVSTAAFHARVRGSVPGLGRWKKQKLFPPHPRVKVSIVGSLRDREVACSAFETCVWRTVSSQSSHHPQEVLLAQFSLYVHK